jgi:uncharacterized protein YktA (UPF0223 family)
MMHHCANEFNVVLKLLKKAAQEEKVLLDFEKSSDFRVLQLARSEKTKRSRQIAKFLHFGFFKNQHVAKI